jgi:hypothetical protein
MFLLIRSQHLKIASALCIPKRVRIRTDQHKEEEVQEVVYFVGHFWTGQKKELGLAIVNEYSNLLLSSDEL